MPIINLRDWDTSGTLGPSSGGIAPKPQLSSEQIIGMLTGLISKGQENKKASNQDLQWRQAAKAELGVDLPLGMGKLYPEMVQKKFEANLDPEKKLYEQLLSGVNNPSTPAATAEAVDYSQIPGTQPATPTNGLGVDSGKILRGLISKKFGIPYEELMTPEEKQNKRTDTLQGEIAKKELSSMATMLPKLDQAFQAANQLEDLYYKGATPDANPLKARLTGIPDAILAKSGGNPQLNAYMNNLKAFSGLISKGGFGEAGMLTQQDIERVINAFPTSSSSAEEAKLGFAEVKKILGAARSRFENTKKNYISGGMTGDILKDRQNQGGTPDPLSLR